MIQDRRASSKRQMFWLIWRLVEALEPEPRQQSSSWWLHHLENWRPAWRTSWLLHVGREGSGFALKWSQTKIINWYCLKYHKPKVCLVFELWTFTIDVHVPHRTWLWTTASHQHASAPAGRPLQSPSRDSSAARNKELTDLFGCEENVLSLYWAMKNPWARRTPGWCTLDTFLMSMSLFCSVLFQEVFTGNADLTV